MEGPVIERLRMRLARGARIVVVSDTHMPRMAKQLPPVLRAALVDADLVVHAGDWVTPAALEQLEAFAPVVGVAGNNDDADIRQRFPAALLLEFERMNVGVIHGHEGRGANTPARALHAFAGADVDLVVYGHSHIPLNEQRGEVLLFNPGSPTDKRLQPRFSFGLLDLDEGVRAEHVFFDAKV